MFSSDNSFNTFDLWLEYFQKTETWKRFLIFKLIWFVALFLMSEDWMRTEWELKLYNTLWNDSDMQMRRLIWFIYIYECGPSQTLRAQNESQFWFQMILNFSNIRLDSLLAKAPVFSCCVPYIRIFKSNFCWFGWHLVTDARDSHEKRPQFWPTDKTNITLFTKNLFSH